MAPILKYFQLAKQIALKGDSLRATRKYRLGAVGVRTDGTVVTSNNLPARNHEPRAHAERRVVQKLDRGSVVYVVRILRDGCFALARPCKKCQTAMRLRGVKTCYYTITDAEFGVICFN